MPEVRHPKTTSLNPFEMRRCLQLKVWDVENTANGPASVTEGPFRLPRHKDNDR